MKYEYTRLEDQIKELYTAMGIHCPFDMELGYISSSLKVDLNIGEHGPFRSGNSIHLQIHDTPEEQWESFGHEICHVLWHAGNQLFMANTYRLKQEWQARNFALHFCVPTFMLLKLDLPERRCEAVELIAETFGVTHTFANQRLQHLEKQYLGKMVWEEIVRNGFCSLG
ncbi:MULTISPECIES: ImmA/IrrE family metallo-endopeptidase [Pontibacillus]|uniref:ImmA/IrrE family metallo-endopeptidase n=1 Tax=Pontibacillus chungwhensis TaxID=265426 RepID=A0ABY8V136_9BACI|nr:MULTISPECIES: ImmA/IrrE family metallo-endopeptidase [Pontibacillus]MCD5324742.1 ImmA/IrrE family metallo-endopeptidase [Pontibacillus sp. HN14]WIF98701.1 ImmA/IrrE family metallo-endopeptidase [Pontibacillus chungwhensis]